MFVGIYASKFLTCNLLLNYFRIKLYFKVKILLRIFVKLTTIFLKKNGGTSLVIQWLRIYRAQSSNPGQELDPACSTTT